MKDGGSYTGFAVAAVAVMNAAQRAKKLGLFRHRQVREGHTIKDETVG